MIMVEKRKFTSGVAVLCALMILIGIVPMNIFGGNSAEAAGTTTIYFDTYKNSLYSDADSGSWSVDGPIYCYAFGGNGTTADTFQMTLSTTKTSLYGGKIFEVTINSNYTSVIFKNISGWSTTQKQTEDISLSNYSGYNEPCYYLSGFVSTAGNDQWKRTASAYDLRPSLEGREIYFKDMTENLQGNITAEFTGDGITETNTVNVINGSVTIPNDVSDNSYTTVEFKNGETSLGKYNLFNKSSGDIKAFKYDENTCNTFYYGATEKADGTIVSNWGAKSTGTASINKKLYLDNLSFSVNASANPTITYGSTTAQTLVADSNDEKTYSHTVSGITQQDIITVEYNGTKYHFIWCDETKDMLTLNDSIANLSDTYVKGYPIYFDATLSKLSYAGTDSIADNSMPRNGEDIYCYAWNSSSDSTTIKMSKLQSHSENGNTWSDVYRAVLTKQYNNVVFYSSSTSGVWPSSTSASAQTVNLSITDYGKYNSPCFYADTSDDSIYNNTKRSGYWGEVYKIRDAETGKTGKDVVDIKQSNLTKDSSKLYVNSTFYDYYTDYELNGNNRDNYTVTNTSSHRNWVNFRQFDQALSDYYKDNNVGAGNAIYTGHFQPNEYGSTAYPFGAIAGTLGLYGYSENYRYFISNNNSGYDSIGVGEKYAYATQNIVDHSLSDGGLPQSYGTETILPYFDEQFLMGNNSKNTKIGDVYNNVAFPFTKQDVNNNGVDYWVFDSAKTTLAMRQDTATSGYFLEDVGNSDWSKNVNASGTTTGDAVSTTFGFFPFNETTVSASGINYNYGFGTKLEFKFRLTDDGQVEDKNGNKVPIEFEFSGDDDVWVFIDGKLALDVGGDHGKAVGKLNFKDKNATVSSVKTSANNNENTGNNVVSSFSMSGSNTDEHTLTMYYMERGMWESNMRIMFNFPDENKLEVEKIVDTESVNDNFKGFFDDLSIFTFDIKNLATHYGSKEVTTGGDTVDPITFSEFDGGVTLKPTTGNTFAYQSNYKDTNNVDKNNIIKWYAKEWNEEKKYTDLRLGTMSFTPIDISKMEYLSFDICVEKRPIQIGGVYICLTDSSGKKAYAFLDANKLYGTPIVAGNTWSTFKVILSKLTYESDFDKKSVASISFQYDQEQNSNYWSNVYLDNFTFQPTVTSTLTGFVTKQSEIPDYGSATSGNLEIPVGAQYKSSEGTNHTIGEDGKFVLKNKESVTFYDQFRRGSYIYLNENLTEAQKKLFGTKYTMYEDDVAVTGFDNTDKILVKGVSKDLKDVNSTTVDDGRTENITITGPEGTNPSVGNAYNGTKPSDSAFVFRSYSDPDNVQSASKLKVVYTNSVKTSNVTISKKQVANDSKPLTGKYKFYVEFTNVGGIGLVKQDGTDSVLLGPFELGVGDSTTITGIPVGTEYKIHEVVARQTTGTDSAVVDNILGYVSQTEPTQEDKVDFNKDTVTDGEVKYDTWAVSSSVSYNATAFSFDFYNIYMPTIPLKVEKTWNVPSNYNYPTSISLKLQRSSNGVDWEDVNGYKEFTLSAGDGWSKTINDLNKYVDTHQLDIYESGYDDSKATKWQYRVIELDTDNKFIVTYGNPYNGQETTEEAPYTLKITNLLKASIKITKVDSKDSNTKLSDAKFKIAASEDDANNGVFLKDSDGNEIEVTTDDNGIATFENLEYKKYYIKETQAPSGYQISNEVKEVDLSTLTSGTFELGVRFENSPIILPEAGGPGSDNNPFNFVLFGIGAIALAGIAFILLNKKYNLRGLISSSAKEVR